jgi:hypothetical protein
MQLPCWRDPQTTCGSSARVSIFPGSPCDPGSSIRCANFKTDPQCSAASGYCAMQQPCVSWSGRFKSCFYSESGLRRFRPSSSFVKRASSVFASLRISNRRSAARDLLFACRAGHFGPNNRTAVSHHRRGLPSGMNLDFTSRPTAVYRRAEEIR